MLGGSGTGRSDPRGATPPGRSAGEPSGAERSVISVTTEVARFLSRSTWSRVQVRGLWSITHRVPRACPSRVISGTPR
jgi:hypothetical protein